MGEQQSVILRNGDAATIEKVSIADARDVLAFFKKVRAETTFSSLKPAEVEKTTLQEQECRLSRFDIPSAGVMLKALVNGELAGLASFHREQREKLKHAGVFGLNVLQSYWGFGLGRALATAIIKEARVIEVSRIELRVREDNLRAISLYESLGFQHEGRLRKAFRVNEHYFDEHIMGLLLD